MAHLMTLTEIKRVVGLLIDKGYGWEKIKESDYFYHATDEAKDHAYDYFMAYSDGGYKSLEQTTAGTQLV